MQTTDLAETALATPSDAVASAPSESTVSLACFEVGARLYAVDVAYVREIVRVREVTPLPMSPPLIEGIVELRDGVVPLIDLGRVLGGEPCEIDGRSRIAVLDFDELVVGLLVEQATDVLSLDARMLEDPPALTTHGGYEAIRSLVRRSEQKPVLVLSLEHILERVYCSGRGAEGDGG